MSKFSPIDPRKLIKIIKKIGFQKVHQKGSHAFFEHPDGRTTVVPMHYGEDIGKGLLRDILKDIELTVDDFNQLKR
ncbi:MAG: type II toxin-antitoxin system HicA family toxin [Patescibacteria group bacterium]